MAADTVTAMSNAAAWASAAGNKFREIARNTDDPTTKLLAEGLTHLAEGVRELDQQIEALRRELRDSH